MTAEVTRDYYGAPFQRTPRDPVSKLPLLISPSLRELPLNRRSVADWHHLYHPEKHSTLFTTVRGKALRVSRMQLVSRRLHNMGPSSYHALYGGPELPETEEEHFESIVPACAGYIPDEGIDLRSGEPDKTVRLSPAQRDLLTTVAPGLYAYRYLHFTTGPVKRFLTHYVVRQDIGRPPEVDAYLHTQDPAEYQRLGHLLLTHKLEVAVQDVRSQYAELYGQGRLHPDVPSTAHDFVKTMLGNSFERQGRVYPLVAKQLERAVG